ncbi:MULTISPECIES: hypothetical protein [unclassified Thermosipho (in: thermotogales)]|uniref:hypothetical protein n=1 Tax=unclassified Thermosipho (in: thermotogales) TaxID=2676525 RepID=UPI0009869A07|nr:MULTISPECIES: hypothetical protein [unclassified Thermosipho (in: thermotogales)]MBT1247356.1 hypothetical protein [Thermosipho sp. 1244]OOC46954.1 hypothetical protein XO09_04145 [Thermosipho sp. 1223]
MSNHRKRLKASDVFQNSKYVFGEKVSFEEAFLEIEDIVINVEESGRWINKWNYKRTYTKQNFPGEYIDCRNPLCYNGGFSMGAILRNMVKNRQTELETLEVCQGYEGSPKGKKFYKKCLNQFKIKVSIKYKETTE